ncbi:MAG: ABC transporter permease [Geminicoccaceae bacterium]
MPAAGTPAAGQVRRAALGPWASAARKLGRDRAAMTALLGLFLIIMACLLAPAYARYVSGTDPFRSNLDGTFLLDGQTMPVMEQETEGLGLGFTPVGPTWRLGPYMLGADSQGRDVAARLLYGGRNSLMIGVAATAICLVLAAIVGVVAGYFGGIVDLVLGRLLDVLWAFPVYLLAISLSIVLIAHGVTIGPITITSGSLLLPIAIIGLVYVPYVARPVRGQVLSLERSEFVLAAVGLGVPAYRILLRDVLPNIATTLIVFCPLMLAIAILTESALSFLSIGVQPPDASWGTIIQDGQTMLYTRPWVALAPGIAIVLTVLALNILGDGVRDALDPRAKIQLA